jgi:hypothetical protein
MKKLIITILGVIVLSSTSWGATAFTSKGTGGGNWNLGTTWNKTSCSSGCVAGTDYPGAVGDTFATTGTDTITLNVQITNALGASTIAAGTTLAVSPTVATGLAFGNVNLTLAGTLNIGTSGTPINASYLSLWQWATTDTSHGLAISNGGVLNVYGDPNYYGGTSTANLSADWTTGQSFTVTGDFHLWPVNGRITVHKNTTYSSFSTDTLQYTIASASYSSGTGLTTITINQTAPAVTFHSGGQVNFVDRNVQFFKTGSQYPSTIGTYVTNGPQITDSNNSGTHNINVTYCGITGFQQIGFAYNAVMSGAVTSYSNNYGFAYGSGYTLTGSYIYSNNYGFFYGSGYTLTGSYIYSNNYGFAYGSAFIDPASSIGYTGGGVSATNTTDVVIDGADIIIAGAKTQASLVISDRNLIAPGRVVVGDYSQVVGKMQVLGAFGTMVISNTDGAGGPPTRPTQRPGGSSTVMEVTEQTNISTTNTFPIFAPIGNRTVRIWQPAGAVTRTYRWYVSNPNATTLTTAGLSLTAAYLDSASGTHITTVTSSTTVPQRANSSDWSQYIQVTVPATSQSGWVDFHLTLTQYIASFILWIDPAYVVF